MDFSLQSLRVEWVSKKGIAPEDFLVLSLFVLGINKTHFFQNSDYSLTKEQYILLVSLLERRFNNEPAAYLIGTKEFFGRNFLVTKATLIPRPDSECLIEDVISLSTKTLPEYIFDIGTGSGALALTLRKEIPDQTVEVIASDISEDALVVAKENAKRLAAPVTFLHGSLLAPYQTFLSTGRSFFIIANLPYVSRELLDKAAPDVKDFEPFSALFSEEDGLAHYRALLKEMKRSTLNGTVTCWLEISPEQKESLTKDILTLFPHTTVVVGQDLAGKDRFLRFQI